MEENNEKTKEIAKYVVSKIVEEYSEERVELMFDEQLTSGEWLYPGWEDEHESEYDAYICQGRGEIEDSIIEHMITWYQSKYDKFDNLDVLYEVNDSIKEEYDILLNY